MKINPKKIDVLIGLQAGDEGKGAIIDRLAPRYDIIARFQGGPNAGHTLTINKKAVVLHVIPSGVFQKKCLNLIGNGVVIDPILLMQEIKSLKKIIPDIEKRILISLKTILITPSHILLDKMSELSRGNQKIGSTLRGIGPAYQDSISRNGLPVSSLIEPNFKQRYNVVKKNNFRILESYNEIFSNNFSLKEFEKTEKEWLVASQKLKKLNLVNCEYFLNTNIQKGKNILAEGAQGFWLDVMYGTYPFVTSSNTITAGVCTGLGVSPSTIGKVIGIVKAYTTRVGSGPFLTEQDNETGEKLRAEGHEYGATTGRARRCGWLDLPGLKYAIMVNGVTSLAITKLDVLDSFKKIKVCTGYQSIKEFSMNDFFNPKLKPLYREFDGWQTQTTEIRDHNLLPLKAQKYLNFIEKELGVPIQYISVGPDRTQMLEISS